MSAAAAAAAAAALSNSSSTNSNSITDNYHHNQNQPLFTPSPLTVVTPVLSRYESQKRRDWITFGQYLKNHRPPLNLSRCSGAHVRSSLGIWISSGRPRSTRMLALSTDTLILLRPVRALCGRLRAAWTRSLGGFRQHLRRTRGHPETNPFGARAVRLYLREVRDSQAKARGIVYEKKKRKKVGPSPCL